MPRILFALIATLLSSSAWALIAPPPITIDTGRQLWVSPTGSDTATGLSPTTAFKTLQHAEAVTLPGDVVNVMPGTYAYAPYRHAILGMTYGGTANAWVHWKAQAGAIVSVGINNWLGIEVLAPYVYVEGFEVIGCARVLTQDFIQAHKTDGSQPGNNEYGMGVGSHHIRLRNNKVHDNSGIGGGGDYIVLDGNEVYGNGNWSPYATGGIGRVQPGAQQFDNAPVYHNFIINNRVHDNIELIGNMYAGGGITDGNGIIIDSNQTWTPYTGRTLIANNIVYNNGGAGIHIFQSAHIDIFFNTAVNNNANIKEGEIEASKSSDVRISSNIMVARAGSYARGGWSDTNVSYDYNVILGPATSSAVPDGPHDILADPLFVTGGYALQPRSPAIGAADPSLVPYMNSLGAGGAFGPNAGAN